MSSDGAAPTATLPARQRSAAPAATTGFVIYGCEPDEDALFRESAARFGVALTVTEAAVCEDNVALAAGHRCVSIGHKTRVTDATLHALSRAGVEYVSTRSIGYDHLDVAYAESIGLRVGNVAYSPDSVADYTLMLMMMGLRHGKATVRRGDAHDYRLPPTRGRELRDLTVGVVGTGRIGSAVIDRLRAFGCRVLACDTRARLSHVGYTSLDRLLRHSDIVTLHTPLTAETHHLLSGERIARMKRGALVVNTGRGALLDTEALVAALEAGHLGGAALDVLEGEEGVFYADWRGRRLPHEALARLQEMPNVLISPHTAYYTDHALRDTVENSLVNCMAFEKEKSA
ncbi:D-specific alpha-keto acid dehydrogenase [Stackebrandtia albiflava]|uniref:D-specific alpha-keto acid dehydrogenase n=1 Tax=Stackebrandtia albiflava TaxID=406432 RepID=A0A562V2I8_9ACTN|nr:D-isomer specific 2-hydroxyacid dehydrogenase family protein [Stackebrandtia albiflava]TWJ12109.1 D-specific alpha-keto acid dehydrogenase [Stackebrandtia albiflava]